MQVDNIAFKKYERPMLKVEDTELNAGQTYSETSFTQGNHIVSPTALGETIFVSATTKRYC